MSKKQLTAYEVVKEIKKVTNRRETPPWEMLSSFGSQCSDLSFAHDQISFGEDYRTVDEHRKTIEWIVKQLNGEVKWK